MIMSKPSKHVTTSKTGIFLKTTRSIWEPGARAGQLMFPCLRKENVKKKAIANQSYTYWTVKF